MPSRRGDSVVAYVAEKCSFRPLTAYPWFSSNASSLLLKSISLMIVAPLSPPCRLRGTHSLLLLAHSHGRRLLS